MGNPKVVDLTHFLTPDMPVYPGTEPPQFLVGNTIEKDGFEEKKITFFSHTGTHMDAPAHILSGKATLDRLAPEQFIGSACVLDMAACLGKIELEHITAFQDLIQQNEFVLLRTGWSRYWGQRRYFDDFPTLTLAAAEWLSSFPLKGIGVDAISVDPMDSSQFPVHRVFFGRGMIIVENLSSLDALPQSGFLFSCFPLKIVQADGSPIRAMALL